MRIESQAFLPRPVGIGHARSSSGRDQGAAMLYAILCYNSEAVTASWTKEEDDAVLAKRHRVTDRLAARGKLGPVVIDGPFAETKEQLLGFYIVDCASLEEAITAAKDMVDDTGALEIRPLRL